MQARCSGFWSSRLENSESYLPVSSAGILKSGSTAILFLPGLRVWRNPSTCCYPRVQATRFQRFDSRTAEPQPKLGKP